MGAAATHVLRSVAGRELLDLDQTLHEANKQRCIERVREQRGLFLELCRRSDAVEPIKSPSEPPVAPSVPASVSALHCGERSTLAQGHAGSGACLSEMNADLLPEGKVVTGHGGTGKWTRNKAFGFSRRVRSRPKATPMRMRYDPRKSAGKGKGRNKDNHDYITRTITTTPDHRHLSPR